MSCGKGVCGKGVLCVCWRVTLTHGRELLAHPRVIVLGGGGGSGCGGSRLCVLGEGGYTCRPPQVGERDGVCGGAAGRLWGHGEAGGGGCASAPVAGLGCQCCRRPRRPAAEGTQAGGGKGAGKWADCRRRRGSVAGERVGRRVVGASGGGWRRVEAGGGSNAVEAGGCGWRSRRQWLESTVKSRVLWCEWQVVPPLFRVT